MFATVYCCIYSRLSHLSVSNMMTALTCNLKHMSENSCEKFDNVMDGA